MADLVGVLDGGYNKGPKNKIRLQGARIQIGDRDFTSASEALQAYLDQYAGVVSKPSMYDMNVTDLLDPKSSLRLTADRSLKTGVRDTPTELRLSQTKDKITSNHERMMKSSSLRAEGNISVKYFAYPVRLNITYTV